MKNGCSTNYQPTLHADGTITYWAVYRQRWVRRVDWMPLEEQLALQPEERELVRGHILAARAAEVGR